MAVTYREQERAIAGTSNREGTTQKWHVPNYSRKARRTNYSTCFNRCFLSYDRSRPGHSCGRVMFALLRNERGHKRHLDRPFAIVSHHLPLLTIASSPLSAPLRIPRATSVCPLAVVGGQDRHMRSVQRMEGAACATAKGEKRGSVIRTTGVLTSIVQVKASQQHTH